MRVLALDTTSRAGSAAVIDDDRLLIERGGDAARSLAERMPTDLLDTLDVCGLTVQDIDLFAVASGPGPFTTLRIGIATIQGMALVTGKQVVAVSALEALATLVGQSLPSGTCLGVWTDAFRHDVFSALFTVGRATQSVEEVDGAVVDAPATVWARWATTGRSPTVMAGEGALLYRSVIPAEVDVRPSAPLAAVIARMAIRRVQEGLAAHPAAVQPLYVRRPDAEIIREAKRMAGASAPPDEQIAR